MNKSKIFDCITFFDENFLTNLRFEILDEVVDNFIVCESKFDHKGNPKPINFFLTNHKFKNKVRHLIIEEQFPDLSNGWLAESYQREKIFDALKDATMEDYILFSDSDEIPNPKKLKNLSFKKKFAIFLQKFFVYKMNIYNKHETPWEGTRVCKKKFLKSFTHLRKKVLKKNINKPFWKFKTEKSIEIIEEGGWHFNNLYNFETISKKIKTFPHKEYDIEKFTNIENIKKRINNMEDLFDRGYKFEKISIDQTYPEYVKKNIELFRDYLI
tara:strand:+ start:543 stop:1352 length:810 start_codon:yes stop_codon:yes gene_type:complete